MRYLVTILLVVFIGACKQSDTGNATAEPEFSGDLPDLSIFNLPSKWITQEHEEIELADLRGRVLVVAMIYSTCQFACPRLVADMKDIESKIPEDRLNEINIVLVSIDPERDQPDTLRQFALENELPSSHWTLLHGENDNVLEFSATLGVKYKKVSPIDFSHSNIISVFDREGVLVYQQNGYGVDNRETVEQIMSLLNKLS